MRTNMVGTHWLWVIECLSISSSARSASKCSMITEVPPSRITVRLKRSGAAW